ncbi:MAG: HAMP domain-containing sensor histidine kinase [Bacteroidota bacterium]
MPEKKETDSDDSKELLFLKQELDRAHLLRDTLVRIVNHDLRGPMGNLKSILSLILEGQMDAETAKAFFEQADAGIEKSVKMLEELVEWGGANSVFRERKVEELSLSELVDRAFAEHYEKVKNKNLNLINRVDQELKVPYDEKALNVILRQLLSNAIKFTKSTGIVEVTSKEIEGLVYLAVADSGVGIPDEMKPELFDMKKDSRRLGTKKEKSAGVGLFICQDLISERRGVINVLDNLPTGTIVEFSLPDQTVD